MKVTVWQLLYEHELDAVVHVPSLYPSVAFVPAWNR